MTDPMTAMQSIRMQAMWNAYRSSFSASGQAGAGDPICRISGSMTAINTFALMRSATSNARITHDQHS